jgi:hypothetical protein
VYSLLNTLRCKRCKGIWKEGDDRPAAGCSPAPDNPLMVRKQTEPLEARLAKRLDECLARSGGRFCPAATSWQAGEISPEVFRSYVRQCVKDRSLAEEKDSSGRTWYRRPGKKDPKRRFTGAK